MCINFGREDAQKPPLRGMGVKREVNFGRETNQKIARGEVVCLFFFLQLKNHNALVRASQQQTANSETLIKTKLTTPLF